MKKIKILAWSLALLLLILAGNAAALTITIYTDKNDWIAAVGGPYMTETFTDDVFNTGVSVNTGTQGHVNIPQGVWSDTLNSDSQNPSFTIWSFDPQIKAFGGTWTLGGPGGSGNYLVVTLAEFSIVAGYIGSGYNNEFWGFVCDEPFSQVTLTGGLGDHQQSYDLDNMVYGPAPLPGAAYLLGTGLLAIFLRRKS